MVVFGVSAETDIVCNLSEKGRITTTCFQRRSELSVEQLVSKRPQSENALQLELKVFNFKLAS